jgi:hypothetical protein
MAEGKPTKPETLAMRQSAVQQLTASEASMSLSAAGSVEAEHVDSKMSALGQVYADSLNAELSLVGVANGIQAVLRDGAAVAVVSDAAVLDHATAAVLVAREVHGPLNPYRHPGSGPRGWQSGGCIRYCRSHRGRIGRRAGAGAHLVHCPHAPSQVELEGIVKKRPSALAEWLFCVAK